MKFEVGIKNRYGVQPPDVMAGLSYGDYDAEEVEILVEGIEEVLNK